MKIKSQINEKGWSLVQRIYATRCRREVEITNLILKWWDEEKEKSLDKLEQLLEKDSMESLAGGKIISMRNSRGKYVSPPHHREYEISFMKPNRAAFIVVGEPFAVMPLPAYSS